MVTFFKRLLGRHEIQLEANRKFRADLDVFSESNDKLERVKRDLDGVLSDIQSQQAAIASAKMTSCMSGEHQLDLPEDLRGHKP
jgi:hypothetical protein